jgi:hypothetical protein
MAILPAATALLARGVRAYGPVSLGIDVADHIVGVDRIVGQLVKMSVKWAIKARQVDDDAAEDMVERMRAEVPRRTGLLFNGISHTTEGEFQVVTATAHARRGGKEGADYARFVEFGTKPHTRGSVADAEFHQDATGAGAGRRRGHPGTAPRPFFYPAVRAVLAERGRRLEDVIDETATEEGF